MAYNVDVQYDTCNRDVRRRQHLQSAASTSCDPSFDVPYQIIPTFLTQSRRARHDDLGVGLRHSSRGERGVAASEE
jgi:hypothetical protein